MSDQRSKLDLIMSKAKAQAEALTGFVKNSDPSQLSTLNSFMAGEITHLFVSGYSPKVIDWLNGDLAYDMDNWGSHTKLEGIKLVSLYGKSDGSLEYRLCQYRDGSGGGWTTIFPATSYKEALAMAQAECDQQAEAFLSGDSTSFYISEWEKIDGIVISEKSAQKHADIASAAKTKRIEELRSQLEKLESEK